MSDPSITIIGSEEWCGLPDLGIPVVKSRVDSGAKTSSLHAFNIQKFRVEGDLWVSFDVHPLQNDARTVVQCKAAVVDRRTVKSSSGETSRRYVIRTPIQLGEERWEIEVTLANRDSMGYRMLLGREAMTGRVLIDPQASLNFGEISEDLARSHYKSVSRKSSGMRMALLASNPNLYSNLHLMEAGLQAGHQMEFINIKQCHMLLTSDCPGLFHREGRTLEGVDGVIPRIRPSITYYGCAVVRQFQAMGIPCMNSSKSITTSRDKLHSLQVLQQNDLPIPVTGFANSPNDTEELISGAGGAPVIVKLLEGTQGKGVVLAETDKAAESVVNAFKSLNANILVQEFVKEANGIDIRCFVVGNKVVAAMSRTAPPGEFRANVHLGGKVNSIKITPEERRIAVKATKVLGLDVAGVDIIRGKQGPMILEVNSSPGLEGIEAASGLDIARLMIAQMEKMIEAKRAKKERTSRVKVKDEA